MSKNLKGLVDFLRTKKDHIVKQVEVRVQVYDPTYGPRSQTVRIEVIDFESLLQQMDAFSEQFKEKPKVKPRSLHIYDEEDDYATSFSKKTRPGTKGNKK